MSRLEWMTRAACAGMIRFTDMTPGAQKRWCRHCPVRSECAEFGLTLGMSADDSDGSSIVYGGLTTAERRNIKKRGRR